jgi:hypothetical protein
VSQDHASRGRGAASDHVLVGAADVCRDHLEYYAMVYRLSCRIDKFRIVDGLNRDFTWSKIDDATIGRHAQAPRYPKIDFLSFAQQIRIMIPACHDYRQFP